MRSTVGTSRPTISDGERARRRRRRLDGRDRPPVTEDRDAVGDRLHLVELVRDEDHGPALVCHHAHRLEERLRLLRRQHGGRLVEDQDLRLAVERLQDLDALLLAERELPDTRVRVDGDVVALAELGDAPLDVPGVHEEAPSLAAMVAEDHVLGHGERLHEPEVLVHHADAGDERVPRRVEYDPLAVEEDLPVVRAVEPGEDVRERRLAGAVLAEERVHLTLGRLEVDIVIGDNAREPLRDVPELDCGSHEGARAGSGQTTGTPPAVSR